MSLCVIIDGGLGNQLFQIFTTIAYAIKYQKSFFFLNNTQLGNGENGLALENDNDNNNDNDIASFNCSIMCPICRTICNTYTQIYF